MTIGENIRRIRKEKGYTQKQLAEKCEMYESQIRKYELDKANPKIDTLKKIAIALDCEVSDIDENIFVISIPKYELTPERLERIKQNAEAEELIKRRASGEEITEDEQRKISDYIERTKEDFSRLHESVEGIKNVIKELEENIMLSDYRKLNLSGKEEARKRVNELTEIPRYTTPDEPPQE